MKEQWTIQEIPSDSLILKSDLEKGRTTTFPDLRIMSGLTIIIIFTSKIGQTGDILYHTLSQVSAALDVKIFEKNRTKGLKVYVDEYKKINVFVTNGFEINLDCGKDLFNGNLHTIGFVFDGYSKILSIVVDEILCDGGSSKNQGWRSIPNEIDEIEGTIYSLGENFDGKV